MELFVGMVLWVLLLDLVAVWSGDGRPDRERDSMD